MTASLALAGATPVPQPGQRIDLKVLVLTRPGDAVYPAWQAALEREGIPYDTIVVPDAAGEYFTDSTLADYAADHAKYQAVILPWGDLPLTTAEQQTLSRLESTFGIRRLSDDVWPSAAHGLNPPTYSGSLDGRQGTLTPTGKLVFPYLVGDVPIPDDDPAVSETYGYEATPVNEEDFTTLVAGPNGSAYLGVHTRADGTQEMVSTVSGNQYQLHEQLLRHGMLGWVTRGVYLGYQRNYLDVEVDDVFMPDDRWDVDANKTAVEDPNPSVDEYQCDTDPATTEIPDCLPPIRMTPADVTRLADWQSANGLLLDMVFNGAGSDEADQPDPLTQAFVAGSSRFRWVNHTYSHLQLDSASLAQIVGDISQNLTWAAAKGLTLDATELVTGEHSGLHNPSMPEALAQTGVLWVAADNSREPDQYAIGSALTVPRYPSNVYYNVGTRAEELDEYNWLYALPPDGNCSNSASTTCYDSAVDWQTFLDSEAGIVFGHLMGNDPRPHFAHQSNLAEDGILYDLLDTVVARYRSLFTVDLAQLSLADAGRELQRQADWKNASDGISAYVLDGKVHVSNTTGSAITVPLTGTSVGTLYGGRTSGLATIPAGGEAVFDPSDPTSVAPPTISGSVETAGGTLTATTGAWSGTDPVGFAYQWQRSSADGTTYESIADATEATYQTSAADQGRRLRVVVSAFNWVSAVSQAVSAATEPVGLAPPVSTAPPTIDGTAQEGQTLTASVGTWTGSDLTFTFGWERSPDGTAAWTPIPDATAGASYTATAGDVDAFLRVGVVATNAGGSTTAYSDPVGPVLAAASTSTTTDTTPTTTDTTPTTTDTTPTTTDTTPTTTDTTPTTTDTTPTTTDTTPTTTDTTPTTTDTTPTTTSTTPTTTGTTPTTTQPSPAPSGSGSSGSAPAPPSTVTAQSVDTPAPERTTPAETPAVRPRAVAVTGLAISPRRFLVTGAKRGATVNWTVSGPASLRLTVERLVTGRKVGDTCRPVTSANSGNARCLRRLPAGTITRSVATGTGKLRFTGTIGHRQLRPGRYRLVATVTPAGAPGPTTGTRTATFTVLARPALTRLRISPSRFLVTGAKRGATVNWTVSGPASLRLTVERLVTGRKVGDTCRPVTSANSGNARCLRRLPAGTITRSVATSTGKLRFTGTIGHRQLRPGRYRLVATVTPAGAPGPTTGTRTATFTVLEPTPRK